MDALSDILRVVRLSGAIFFHARFTAPFSYQAAQAHDLMPVAARGEDHLVIFHLITEGECWAVVDGNPAVHLRAGDVALLPHGHAHLMASDPGLASAPDVDLAPLLSGQPSLITCGGGGEPTLMVCGFMACDRRLAQLLLAGLPPVVKVGLKESDSWCWLESSMSYALAEARSSRPGGAGVLAKLAEVLFIEVLRGHIVGAGDEAIGWLAGVRDRVVGATLAALHRAPAHPWTLEELARTAGASRSVLAERFQRLMGISPMQYLTQWRMVLAAGLLRGSSAQLTDIAQDVGYQTDTAFIRAFRREYGQPPATWRRAQAQLSPSPAP